MAICPPSLLTKKGSELNLAEFVAKWCKVELKERSAAQEHFLDLCAVVGHPTPAEADPTGETFCFERGAAKHGGGDGFADVWKKDFFAWEYKGKHKDLEVALDQLLKYKDALANPPLLVVCDLDRIVVRTNFTRTVPAVFEVPLETMGEPRSLEILRAVFFDPEKLKPGRTSEAMTAEAAAHLGGVAESMRVRGLDPAGVAHFLNRLVFCLFAEDIGLLPGMIFTRIVEKAGGDPARFTKLLGQLFEAMAHGGDFGLDSIRHFNGNLFENANAFDLTAAEMKALFAAAQLDWGAVDPSIFGTLFERGLDPAKRSQLGAHYTSREDIETLVDPVVMAPLRREWAEARAVVESLLATGKKTPGAAPAKALAGGALKKARGEADSVVHGFLTRLQGVRVLDPACGSGNFLYVTLQKLKDLEKEVVVYAMDRGLGGYLPSVGPWQLFGIEINPYAYDLAQTSVWIGFLQWTRANGFQMTQNPVLRPMKDNFRCMDSILDLSNPAAPKEPEWPKVDFIVGNPPFLGGNRIRQEMGDAYVDALFARYMDRVPAFADLCCYWFEKARAHIQAGGCERAGLLATQGIRGGANREVLKRIRETGGVFWAVSDRDWILDGATVHVSLVGFDNGVDESRMLNGEQVPRINPDLTSSADVTGAATLSENAGLCFMGASPKAPFDIEEATARQMLATTGNPNGRPNSDVVRPVVSGIDLVGPHRQKWTVDFALMPLEEAAQYEAPFEYVKEYVLPVRQSRRADYRGMWWQYARPRPEMRVAVLGKLRVLATPEVSKHRVFVWVRPEVLCNQQVLVFARDDDYFLGVLHSRVHETWARAQGTQLRDEASGMRYTPTTSFETFPLPWRPGREPVGDPRYVSIATAAGDLVEKRNVWLGGVSPGDKKPRTLTRLYNECPAWLANAHAKLDAAVFAAYGWEPRLADDEILARLLELNAARDGAVGK